MAPDSPQPPALTLVSATSIWERFGFYMMRTILVLYMVKVLSFSTEKTFSVFATFSALLYITPQIGGHLADKFFGKRYMITLGGLLLSVGYFLLALPGQTYFYLGLSTIIVGSGFFVPNITGFLGEFYFDNDARREGGFSILYAAVNLGALIPPLISAGLIAKFGWHTAFAAAGCGVLFGVVIFNVGLLYISDHKNISLSFNKNFFLVAIVLTAILLFSLLIKHSFFANIFLSLSSSGLILYIIKQTFNFSREVRNRLIVSFVLTIFSIFFWALYAQGAMSLTIFAEYDVQRHTSFGMIPTTMFLALSPLYIILLGPVFAKIWIWLASKNLNPSTPVKFSFATIFMGLGFAILPLAIWMQSTTGQINFGWIVLSYLLQSIAELLIAPVGLSMMTELAPKQMVGVMVGTWYLAMAVANALGGFISRATVGSSHASASVQSLSSYRYTFEILGSGAVLAGIFIFLFSGYLNHLVSSRLVYK